MKIFLGQILIVIVRGGRAGYPAWRDNNDSSDSQDPPQVFHFGYLNLHNLVIFRVEEVEGMVVGVVVATGMGEVEGMVVEEVRVMEQEGVGEAQGMEVRKLTLEPYL